MKFSLRARRAWRSPLHCHCESYRSRTRQSRCMVAGFARDCFGLRPRNDNKGIDTSLRYATFVSKTVNKECHREERVKRATWRSRSASKNVPWDCFGLRPRNDNSFRHFAALRFARVKDGE